MRLRLISRYYDKETIDVRVKTNVLQIIFILMSFALAGGVVKNLFVLNYIPMAIFEIVLILFTTLIIVLQYRGWYRLGWSYALSMGFLIAFPLVLSREPSIIDASYMMFCFSIIVLLIGNFSVSKWAFFITAPLIYAGILFMMVTRAVPVGVATGTLQELMDVFYSMIILLVLEHALSLTAWFSNRTLVRELSEREQDVKNKMKTLTGWLLRFRFSTGLSSPSIR